MITLHTYRSRDGITRTRCTRHVARYGPHAINPGHEVTHTQTMQPPQRCIECYHEWIEAHGHLNSLNDD